MKIGFYIKFPKRSLNARGNVIGDELHAEGMRKALLKLGLESCEIYAPNCLPRRGKLDVMVYLNDTIPQEKWANKHILYMQNGFLDGSDVVLTRLQGMGYNGYAFISHKLLQIHKRSGLHGIWLPFGVDTDLFRPMTPGAEYSYEVAYVGNDIKGEVRTLQYIYPATEYNFGLYGNWRLPRRYWLMFWKIRPYHRKFALMSKGKIPQADVPLLYSRSKINLNCTAQDCVDWDVITLRNYEVLACKGFLISDRVPSAERELNDCMAFTDGGKDLEDKIRYYLERPDERARMAQNGYDYVAKNASSLTRMTSFLDYIREIV
jgi:spore maturation protein CgeB